MIILAFDYSQMPSDPSVGVGDPYTGAGTGGNNDTAVQAAIMQGNYQAYVNNGGDPSHYTVDANGMFHSNPNTGGGGYPGYLDGGVYASSRYAPYDVGGGMTKWDEFVKQMQLEQQKLQQAQSIENARLAQEKQLAEEKLNEEQKIADQNTVEAFTKNLTSMQGPKDPYGYLFASRGLSAPQGYAPTALPLPDAVKNAYQSQGVDLAQAQKQLSGSSGPSFINGYLGSMSPVMQQGPMGFQNNPQTNSGQPTQSPQPQQPQSQSDQGPAMPSIPPQVGGASQSMQIPGSQPAKFAQGGMVSGFAPGKDTVPAMLSPGEGVLTPGAVNQIGGPPIVAELNKENSPLSPNVIPTNNDMVQKFAVGGMVANPIFGPSQNVVTPTVSTGMVANPFTGPIQQGTHPNDPGFSFGTPPGGPQNWGWAYSPEYRLANPTAGTAINVGTQPGGNAAYSWEWVPLSSPGDVGTAQGQQTYKIGNVPVGSSSVENMGDTLGAMKTPGVVTQPNGQQVLTGGVLAPPAPAQPPPMNLNMLDPYTRSLVDQYGVPQIPSAQALANMPQSGRDAYQNYVEKVAGGNFQDLLDQSKMLNSQGANPADFKFE